VCWFTFTFILLSCFFKVYKLVKKIKVLVFSGYYLPGFKGGGPIKTIKNLFDRASKDLAFKLVTSDHDLGEKKSYQQVKSDYWNILDNVSIFYASTGVVGIYNIAKIVFQNDSDVIYLNSFFSVRFSLYPQLLVKLFRLKQQIVLGTRGEFSEGALGIKTIKKRLYIFLYKFFRLNHGTVFQASSDYEAKNIASVLGNPADIFIAEDIGSKPPPIHLVARIDGPLRIVFVSRISPMKNLLLALKILKKVKKTVVYHIFGPIEDHEYWQECKKIIGELSHNISVEYKGELMPKKVLSTLSNYDLFFLPTKGENYGHVIAEALCAGLPLLISDRTPWRNLQFQGIGWDLSLDNTEKFSNTIDEFAKLNANEHFELRHNVLSWSKEKFSQQDAVEANINMFHYANDKK
jgi:glycosyltransferase involved in cell wall biosynthesis